MSKSNFNQFFCEDFKKNETVSNSIHDAECETKNQNNQISNANASNSSNIFLSRSVNACQNRFSMNRFHSGNTAAANVNAHPNPNPNPNPNPFGSGVNKNNNVNINVNIFKKMDGANEVENVTTNPSSTSSVTFIEINNETFPSLAPPRTLTKGGNSNSNSNCGNNSSIPKKFKNFKDAISASVPEPAVVSPTKKKQIKALQDLHSFKTNHHPPLFVKRESEILAKSGIYNNQHDDDDDEGFENDARGYNYGSYKSKLTKKQYIRNDDSDDD
jgi:hypothetical protein